MMMMRRFSCSQSLLLNELIIYQPAFAVKKTLLAVATFFFYYFSLAQDTTVRHIFRPQETVLFQDNFSANKIGSFPKNWKSGGCKAKTSMPNDKLCLVKQEEDTFFAELEPFHSSTDHYNTVIEPSIPTEQYLPDSFTIEFDFLLEKHNSAACLGFEFKEGKCLIQNFSLENKNGTRFILHFTGFDDNHSLYQRENAIKAKEDIGNWHHFEMSYYKGTIACFVDTLEVFFMPKCHFTPTRFSLSTDYFGNGKSKFTNVRLATKKYISREELAGFNKLLTEKKLVSHSILFDFNSSVIKVESIPYLKKLAEFLLKNPQLKLEIDGHTDDVGIPEYNLKLSQTRAAEVVKQLVSFGVKKTRLISKGFGSSKPMVSNETEEGKAQNRRVEFVRL
jgi:outer membrane protein OmpA-like peptidoglycan-associated protein